jgi:hypothetical protein
VGALAAGWALLVLGWAMANPPFSSSDEGPHYLRALGLTGGELVGDDAPAEAAPGVNDKQRAWTRQLSRLVEVPEGLLPLPSDCYIHNPRQSAACIEEVPRETRPVEVATSVGTYQPAPYLLPAAVMRLEGEPGGADRLGRLAGGAVAVALLALAALVLWGGTPLSLAGLLVAATPMALFYAGSLNGSGIEIASGIAFFAALLRIARGGPAPAHVWAVAGVAGAALALTRTAGPLWVVLLLGLALALTGPARAWRLARGGGRAAALLGAAVAGAVVLNRAWEWAHGPDTRVSLVAFRSVVGDSIDHATRSLPELVGGLGALEYDLPLMVYVAWFAALALVVAAALRAGRRRERATLATALLAAAVLPPLFYIAFSRHTGFGLQGRHLLPVLAAVPLLAGEIAWRAEARLSALEARLLALALPVAVAACHAVAFHANARRSAVGTDGPVAFLAEADWTPPLGWVPWLLVAVAGAALLAAPAILAAREGGPRAARR